MFKRSYITALFYVILLSIQIVQGDPVSFRGIGFDTYVTAISDNGSVVVGNYFGSGFRWENDIIIYLGNNTSAVDVSADGSVIVGTISDPNGNQEAFRWTASGGVVRLGDIIDKEKNSSRARGVSADGSVVVGGGSSIYGAGSFRWTAEEGMIDLGDLEGSVYSTGATDVSADGSIVIGSSISGFNLEPFRWENGWMFSLGDLGGELFAGIAWGITPDGSVIVGQAQLEGSKVDAFRWESGNLITLGYLPGDNQDATAYHVSANGNVIVGKAINGSGDQVAFIWNANDGLREIKDVLQDDYGLNLTGWQLTEAFGVSADGSIVVGNGINPGNDDEGWIVKFGDPLQTCISNPLGDLSGDCKINLLDFYIMANNWLLDCFLMPENPSCYVF